jgi:hypothetical protein
MTGDCYKANANKILFDAKFQDATLVHGVPLLAGDGLPFGHCWIELDNVCYDFSNGKEFEVEKNLYYEVGGMPVKGYTNFHYTKKDVQKNVLTIGHYGPWEDTGVTR